MSLIDVAVFRLNDAGGAMCQILSRTAVVNAHSFPPMHAAADEQSKYDHSLVAVGWATVERCRKADWRHCTAVVSRSLDNRGRARVGWILGCVTRL
jgi:hypothetical protein